MERISVLVADDQDLVASGIRTLLEAHPDGGFSVVGLARSGEQAVELAARQRPDIVLMEARAQAMDGIAATRQIRESSPGTRVVILTSLDDPQTVREALGSGAAGYLLKSTAPDGLIAAIRAVRRGQVVVSPSIALRLARPSHAGSREAGVESLAARFPQLSRKEAQALGLILQDLSNREMAERMGIAEQTVKNYVSVVYGKLGVPDRMHAMRLVKGLSQLP